MIILRTMVNICYMPMGFLPMSHNTKKWNHTCTYVHTHTHTHPPIQMCAVTYTQGHIIYMLETRTPIRIYMNKLVVTHKPKFAKIHTCHTRTHEKNNQQQTCASSINKPLKEKRSRINLQ